jgi:hypothetical protein
VIHQRDADHLGADEEHFRERFQVLRLGVRHLQHGEWDEQLTSEDISLGFEALCLTPVIDPLGRMIKSDVRSVVRHLVAKQPVTNLMCERKPLTVRVVVSVDTSDPVAVARSQQKGIHPVRKVDEVVVETELRQNRPQVNWWRRDSAPLKQLSSAGASEARPDRFFQSRSCNGAT